MAYEATLPLFSLFPVAARTAQGSLDFDLAALEKRLCKAALRSEPVAVGTVDDPYEPAGEHHAVSRALLTVCNRVEGLELSITTRSPRIVDDLTLLTELDRRHAVTVHVMMTAADPDLLQAVEALAGEGIDTRVLCGPEVDGHDPALRLLFERAWEAGASDVGLRFATRTRLVPRHPPRSEKEDRLLANFRRLRLTHGFPRPVPGRG
jgi:DNA repair photolyase